MAVVALKSNNVTNADASSQTLNSSKVSDGRVKEISATVELANGDNIGSTYRLGRVSSSVRVAALIGYWDAITSGAADFGLYRTAADGGAVVDADFFASAQSIATLNTAGINVAHEAAAGTGLNIDDIEKPLWSALGLTADPRLQYDIAATLTADTTAAGTLSVRIQYCDGN